MAEMIIEVDENNNQIGLREKDEFFRSDYIHRGAHLLLFNSRNEVLLQLRSPQKRLYPNLITFSVDGTVGNETYEECIMREMQEEIGVTVEIERLFKQLGRDEFDSAWHCVFVGRIGSDVELTPDETEIQELIWMDADALRKDLDENPEKYVPKVRNLMKHYFDEYYQK